MLSRASALDSEAAFELRALLSVLSCAALWIRLCLAIFFANPVIAFWFEFAAWPQTCLAITTASIIGILSFNKQWNQWILVYYGSSYATVTLLHLVHPSLIKQQSCPCCVYKNSLVVKVWAPNTHYFPISTMPPNLWWCVVFWASFSAEMSKWKVMTKADGLVIEAI